MDEHEIEGPSAEQQWRFSRALAFGTLSGILGGVILGQADGKREAFRLIKSRSHANELKSAQSRRHYVRQARAIAATRSAIRHGLRCGLFCAVFELIRINFDAALESEQNKNDEFDSAHLESVDDDCDDSDQSPFDVQVAAEHCQRAWRQFRRRVDVVRAGPHGHVFAASVAASAASVVFTMPYGIAIVAALTPLAAAAGAAFGALERQLVDGIIPALEARLNALSNDENQSDEKDE
jgi:hypothetical protein